MRTCPLPRVTDQRLGARRGANDAVVGGQQRHKYVDALQRRRSQAGTQRRGCRRPDRCSLQQQRDCLLDQPERKSAPARFLFATEAGTIAGWSPAVNANVAVVAAERSASGAIYKGLAIANDKLYATDFHNGRVDVFDNAFNRIPGGFSDSTIPRGFAPFGIQTLAGNVFVSYARQDAAKRDDVPAPGQGYVDEFTPDGALIARVVNQGRGTRHSTQPGGSPSRPPTSASSPVTSSWATSGTAGSAPTPSAVRNGSTRASCAHERNACRDRRALGDRLRKWRRCRSAKHPVLRLRPLRRQAWPLRVSDRRLGLATSGRTGDRMPIPGPALAHRRARKRIFGFTGQGGRASISETPTDPCWSSSHTPSASRRVCRGPSRPAHDTEGERPLQLTVPCAKHAGPAAIRTAASGAVLAIPTCDHIGRPAF